MLVVVVVDNCEYGGVLEGLEAHGDGLVFREGRCAQQGGERGAVSKSPRQSLDATALRYDVGSSIFDGGVCGWVWLLALWLPGDICRGFRRG